MLKDILQKEYRVLLLNIPLDLLENKEYFRDELKIHLLNHYTFQDLFLSMDEKEKVFFKVVRVNLPKYENEVDKFFDFCRVYLQFLIKKNNDIISSPDSGGAGGNTNVSVSLEQQDDDIQIVSKSEYAVENETEDAGSAETVIPVFDKNNIVSNSSLIDVSKNNDTSESIKNEQPPMANKVKHIRFDEDIDVDNNKNHSLKKDIGTFNNKGTQENISSVEENEEEYYDDDNFEETNITKEKVISIFPSMKKTSNSNKKTANVKSKGNTKGKKVNIPKKSTKKNGSKNKGNEVKELGINKKHISNELKSKIKKRGL